MLKKIIRVPSKQWIQSESISINLYFSDQTAYLFLYSDGTRTGHAIQSLVDGNARNLITPIAKFGEARRRDPTQFVFRVALSILEGEHYADVNSFIAVIVHIPEEDSTWQTGVLRIRRKPNRLILFFLN